MATAPGHKPRYVGVGDLGDQFVLAEILKNVFEPLLGVAFARGMLRNFLPITTGNIIESQRYACCFLLDDLALCLFAQFPFYIFCFPPRGLFGRAVKATTVDFE